MILKFIYFGCLFAAAITFLLMALLLFLERKEGERSRIILSGLSFLSFLMYAGRIVNFFRFNSAELRTIMDVPFLLLGISIIIIYLIYPIEVISPGYITLKRLLKMYLPVIGLYLFYQLTLWLGIEYTPYETLKEMMRDIGMFQVIFRIILFILIFIPVMFLYRVPYLRKFNNANRKWIRGYVIATIINILAYMGLNVFDTFGSCSLYVIISVSCSLYFTYQELFIRLVIRKNAITHEAKSVELPFNAKILKGGDSDLFYRLEHYMNSAKRWQDPDLSIKNIIWDLHTNRTSLLNEIRNHGYNGYPAYVNDKRVLEFIRIVNTQCVSNFQQTFFDVGFRSKTSALRNFKELTGMTPSEYFQQQADNTRESM